MAHSGDSLSTVLMCVIILALATPSVSFLTKAVAVLTSLRLSPRPTSCCVQRVFRGRRAVKEVCTSNRATAEGKGIVLHDNVGMITFDVLSFDLDGTLWPTEEVCVRVCLWIISANEPLRILIWPN